MIKDPGIFLKHILESVEAIESYIENFPKDKFFDNSEKQDAVVRRLEIIGEAVRNLPGDFKESNPEVSWQDIADMRNKLIHEYFGIDLELVWEVIKKDLPLFKKQIKKLLE